MIATERSNRHPTNLVTSGRRHHWLFGLLLGLLPLLLPGSWLPSYAGPPISETSVYVPGAGFSGFWYHLGLFQSLPTRQLHAHDYYCYSSGCLSLVLGFLQTPVDDTYQVCRDIQQAWATGTLSSYQILDVFLERLLPVEEEVYTLVLPRLHVISTSLASGVQIQQPTNRTELVNLLHRTARIPLLTGKGWVEHDNEWYIDGGFSRMFHPPCRWIVQVPTTWGTYLHSLNPGVGRERVFEFVELGLSATNQLAGENATTATVFSLI